MPEPSPDAWAQIRYDYEHTDRPLEDICVEHGFTANTLRHRARKWGWRMRRPRIPVEGPPPLPAPVTPAVNDAEPSPHIVDPATESSVPIGERLHGAVARVLPAIETTLATLSAGPIRPREMETAARALGSLMRTLRELNALLSQHKDEAPHRSVEELRASVLKKLQSIVAKRDDDPPPENMDEFRNEMARRIRDVVARHQAEIPAKYEAAWHEFAAEANEPAGRPQPQPLDQPP